MVFVRILSSLFVIWWESPNKAKEELKEVVKINIFLERYYICT